MTKKRQDGLLLLVLATAIYLASGLILLWNGNSPPDFKGLYYGARCLLQQSDPYSDAEIRRVYNAEPSPHVFAPAENKNIPFSRAQIYLPGTLLLAVAFAWLPWGAANVLWMILIVVSFVLAAFLVWSLAADYAPVLSACMIGFILTNSFILFTSANPAGIAVSLCLVAVWCFVRERFIAAGVLCLALSLTVKPHDVGFVWLYFLVAGGAHRKRALQSLAIVSVLFVVGSIWVSRVSPHWISEVRANLAESQQHNQIDDPDPTSRYGRTASAIIDLQADISLIQNDPAIYNVVSYVIVAPLLIFWLISLLRSRSWRPTMLLALAPVASLTMLPVYHRSCDAKLLMLAVPACSMLVAEGAPLAWLMLLANGAAIFFTGDIPLVFLLQLSDNMFFATAPPLLKVVLLHPAPILLLAMTVVNLCLYFRRFDAPANALPQHLPEPAGDY